MIEQTTKRKVQIFLFSLFALLCLIMTTGVVVFSAEKQNIQTDISMSFNSPELVTLDFSGTNSTSAVKNSKVVYNQDKTQFKITGVTPIVSNGVTTNMSDLRNSEGKEFYYFQQTNIIETSKSSFDNTNFYTKPEKDVNTDVVKYYVSSDTEEIWYDIQPETFITLSPALLLPNCSTGDKSSIGENTEIVVSNSVTSIPANAFDSSSITSIELPRTISSLEAFAFFNCKYLRNIIIPSSVKDIKEHVFNSCGSLAKVTFFPNSNLQSIGYGGFASCTNLVSITIPSGVSIIGAEAFTNCFKLIEIYNLSPLVLASGSSSYGNVNLYAKKFILV